MHALVSGQARDYCCVRLMQGFVSESPQSSAIPADESQLLRKDRVGASQR